MDTLTQDTKILFGGEAGWSADDWTASDDRVRGGRSQSYFSCRPGDAVAKFSGTLDIDALGGAGFASQRTTSNELSIDLSEYNGLQFLIAGADLKQYTFILKDSLLPRGDDGREQASVSYEYDFSAPYDFDSEKYMLIRVPFEDFKPTYRGRTKEGAKPLNKSSIKRFGFMVRSFFGTQKGNFKFAIAGISAYKDSEDVRRSLVSAPTTETREDSSTRKAFPYPFRDLPEYEKTMVTDEKLASKSEADERQGWCCGTCY